MPSERDSTPQMATIASAILTKTRSRSLVNINRARPAGWDEENLLNGIEESPTKTMRRRSLQHDGVSELIGRAIIS